MVITLVELPVYIVLINFPNVLILFPYKNIKNNYIKFFKYYHIIKNKKLYCKEYLLSWCLKIMKFNKNQPWLGVYELPVGYYK